MRRIVSGLWILAVYWSMFVPLVHSSYAQAANQAAYNRMKDTPPGLTFRLSEGAEGAETREKQPLASSDPFRGGEAGNILKRLSPIASDPDDRAEFLKRIGSLPAPKTGKQVAVKFPSDDQRGTPKV